MISLQCFLLLTSNGTIIFIYRIVLQTTEVAEVWAEVWLRSSSNPMALIGFEDIL